MTAKRNKAGAGGDLRATVEQVLAASSIGANAPLIPVGFEVE